jgi:DNA-binding IclR family transcriptional regulator
MPTDVPAAARALGVLQALSQGPMTAAGLARQVGMPRSSVYQLLAVMADRGFVVHLAAEERWTLGLTAFEVGSAFLRHDPLEHLAQPLLRRLVEEAQRSAPVVAHLGILRGHETLYLLKEQSQPPVTLVTDVGVRLPAALTASGRAILAQLPRAQVRAQFSARDAFIDRTGRGPTSLSALSAQLGRERRQGYAEEDGFITEGYASVAVPVLDRDGRAQSAIGLTFRSDDVPAASRTRFAAAARRCAADLSRRLDPVGRSAT